MSRFIVVCDVDSTLINEVFIDALAETAGKTDAVAAITAKALNGELDYTEAIVQQVSHLKNVPAAVIETVLARISLTAGAATLVDAVHDAGGYIVAVSDGFNELVGPIAKRLGLDAWIANGLEVLDGTLTGRIYGPVIDSVAKVKFLESYAKTKRIPLERTIAVSSRPFALELMSMAGLSVAFCAHPAVQQVAQVRIDERDVALVASLFGKRAGQSLG